MTRPFPTTAALIHRISLAPILCRTPPRPWAPLSDAEWAALAPFLAARGLIAPEGGRARPGRPGAEPRARLDAIFRAVTLKHPKGGRGTWAQLPPAFGKPDTVSRTHRRWAAAGLWQVLLRAVAGSKVPRILLRLGHWICCAYRRAIRVMGLGAIVLARRLGLHSALPAPSPLLPDPDLSESIMPLLPLIGARVAAEPGWMPTRRALKGLAALHKLCQGRARISRWMEPA